MTTIYSKLATAKQQISQTKMEKLWKWYWYNYFTPEQVAILVQKACDDNGLVTLFSLKRNEYWEYGILKVVDKESGESIEIEWATCIPEIKWTNMAQQIGGCLTYTERYLKQSLFWIVDNNLDLDCQQSKVNEKQEKKESTDEKPRFNKEQLEALKNDVEFVNKYDHSDKLITQILTKYRISNEMKWKIADVWAELYKNS